MPRRTIAVYQRKIMPYRRPFFQRVAALLAHHELALTVISADNPGDTAFDANRTALTPEFRPLGVLFEQMVAARDIAEKLVIPRGLWSMLRQIDPALIVTEDLSALPANLQIPAFCGLSRRPYLIWTLGPSIPGKERSRWRSLAIPLIAALRRPANGFICYSSWAAEALAAEYSKPCFVAPNSITQPPPGIIPEALPTDAQRSLRIIFIGRISAQKKLNHLIGAMALTATPVELDLIGDGEEREALSNQVRTLGLSKSVRFHGDIRDDAAKAALIDLAHVGVMPGLGGLMIQELQARACPVIAGPADGTEQDLVRATNPELYVEHPDPQTIAERLDWLAADPARLLNARKAAFGVVQQRYNLEVMAQQWVKAVLATLAEVPTR